MSSSGKYSGRELEYVTRFLDSEDRSNKTSPWSQRFEAAFAEKIASRYAVAHNSGTSALHSALAAAGVGPGDEVISPAMTVVMDSFVTIHLGATPVFADINADTYNIDPQDVIRKITPKTKAIMTVSLQGLPADVRPIMDAASARGIVVVEDCAQTMLGKYGDKYSGTIGHIGCFSFEAKKHLSTGEGGMLVTDDERLAERGRKFGGIGYKNLSAEAGRMSILPSMFQDPYYERFDTVGLNYRMPEAIAAIGLAQLERVDAVVSRRQRVAEMFDRALEGCGWMVKQITPAGYTHTYYTYALQYFGDDRHGIPWKGFWQQYIDAGGDGFYGACRVPYLEPVYRGLVVNDQQYEAGLCPVAERVQPRVMQFKTNYRDLDVAQRKADVLARLIDKLGR